MTDQSRPATDAGARCVCGHPEHRGRCGCGCRRYVATGSHADQSRGGGVPAAVALVLFAALIIVLVMIIVLTALW